MGYEYNIQTSKKDSVSTVSLMSCHTMYSIINIFVSTFLVAHIYSFTSDTFSYIQNVAIFQLCTYGMMFVAYFLFSFIVDKTNRIWVYRIANCIEVVLVLVAIFFGEDLAKLIYLAGLLNGLVHGAYYASYNVLKQEMVSRKSMGKFAVLTTVLGKLVNIVCPVLLGMLIDISTYSVVAIYVLVLAVALTIVSFFVKAKKPTNSGFNLKEYFKILKTNEEAKKTIGAVYKMSFFYAFTSVMSILVSVNVMIQFGSNFSLGAFSSIFSVLSIIVLFLTRKFTKYSKRSWLYYLVASLQLIGAILFALIPCIATLLIFYGTYAVCDVIAATYFDIARNKNLKELGLYKDIAEHQCIVESIFQIIRILTFALLLFVSLLRNNLVLQILFVVFVVMFSIMAIMLSKYEKDNEEK